MPGVCGDRFGIAADVYARHRADFPAEGLDRMADLGVGLAGQRLVDLGCGTGGNLSMLARHGYVTGIETSTTADRWRRSASARFD